MTTRDGARDFPALPPDARDLVTLTRERAQRHPERPLYAFLADGEIPDKAAADSELPESSSYGDLDGTARAIAAELQARGLSGQRALLLYPAGPDFVNAFFGCLYAGVVAVPAYPPQRREAGRTETLLRDSGARCILTTEGLARRLQKAIEAPADVQWLATDQIDDAAAESWHPHTPDADDLAFLQYTSGSTAQPRGVRVAHRHVLANQAMIYRAFGHDADTVVVSWLPLYHDMGLIGGMLQPLYAGGRCVLMAPVAFLRRPVRWLRAIHHFGGTTSGGPDFAYDLCRRRIPDADLEGLDLSSWRVAFNGAEPVRAGSLTAFGRRFGRCGFAQSAFLPCYGLAEATLLVSSSPADQPPVVRQFQRAALEHHQAVETTVAHTPPALTKTLVSCGTPAPGVSVRIVDPQTKEACPPGQVGEVWLAGPSVTAGYHGQPEATQRIFEARLVDNSSGKGTTSKDATSKGTTDVSSAQEAQGFLRTGDLGFLHGGELFLTSRLKDLIILRGRNHHPQDLERSAEESHFALRPSAAAAFGFDDGDGERLVLVLELEAAALREIGAVSGEARSGSSSGEPPERRLAPIRAAISQALAAEHQVTAWAILLVRHGGVPRTSSGKVQRRACRLGWLDGQLPVVAAWYGPSRIEATALPTGGETSPQETADQTRIDENGKPATRLGTPGLHRLGEEVARCLGLAQPPEPDRPLLHYGLDSLAAAELQQSLATYGLDVDLSDLLSGASLRDLAQPATQGAELQEPPHRQETSQQETSQQDAMQHESFDAASRVEEPTAAPDVGTVESPVDSTIDLPLTPGQEALFFLQQLHPRSAAYNVWVAVHIPGQIEHGALRQAFQQLLQRHSGLSMTFRAGGGPPRQRRAASDSRPPAVDVQEAAGRSLPALRAEMTDQAHRPFDLERGPLIRLHLWSGVAMPAKVEDHEAQIGDVLLLTVHHLVADFGSVALLLQELAALYADRRLPPVPGDHAAWVLRQRAWLSSADARNMAAAAVQHLRPLLPGHGERETARQQELPPPLELPSDRPRPALQSDRGERWLRQVPPDTASGLRDLARRHSATPFLVVLTAFEAWLRRTVGLSSSSTVASNTVSNSEQALLGTLYHGRDSVEDAQRVGYLVNPLVLRAALHGISGSDPFALRLARLRGELAATLRHRRYPFHQLVEQLQPRRDPSRSPLFQILVSWQHAPAGSPAGTSAFALADERVELPLAAWTARPLRLRTQTAQFDLALFLADGPGGSLLLDWQGCTDLFDTTTVLRWAGQFESWLGQLVALARDLPTHEAPIDCLQLKILLPAERQALLHEFNDTAWAGAAWAARRQLGGLVHEAIRAQAQRSPGALAVRAPGEHNVPTVELTYAQLAAHSRTLAQQLRALGAGPERLVGVCLPRSAARVVALVAVLEAGAAFLPLDPDQPARRFEALLDDAAPVCLLGDAETPALARSTPPLLRLDPEGRAQLEPQTLPGPGEASEADAPPGPVDGRQLAYVLFTSGSTGRPKGAMNSHLALANRLRWMQLAYPIGADDRVLQKTPFTFDVSVWEFFWPLMTGAQLIVAPPGVHRDPRQLARLAARERVTVVHFVPSMLRAFVDEPGVGEARSLRRIVASGEALSPSLARACLERLPSVQLENLYGPTETAIDVTAWNCSGDRQQRGGPSQNLLREVPIGRPIANLRCHVVDRVLRLQPLGIPGELALAGAGLGRGYLGAPARTAATFVPDPSLILDPTGKQGERLYRTGDLVRYRPDGALLFLGRLDHQLKIRGLRVEAGELEAALSEHPRITDAIVGLHYPSEPAHRPTDRAQAPSGAEGRRSPAATAEPNQLRHFKAGAAPRGEALPAFASHDRAPAQLVAWFTYQGEAPDAAELRAFLGERLPAMLLPSLFVPLTTLPRTQSGKVDRGQLQQLGPAAGRQSAGQLTGQPLDAGDGVSPARPPGDTYVLEDERERALAAVWSRVLGLPDIGVEDNFFELGGDSIRTLQVRGSLTERGWTVALEDLYRHQTIRALAPRLRRGDASQNEGHGAPRVLAPDPFCLISDDDRQRLPAGCVDAYPLTATQTGIVFHIQHDPGAPLYRDIFLCRLQGPLHPSQLCQSAQDLVDRHPMLRTSFDLSEYSRPLQLVHARTTVRFHEVDFSSVEDLTAAEITTWLEEQKAQPLTWREPGLVGFYLLRLAQGFAVGLSFFDAVLDGWSTARLCTEWLRRYDRLLAGNPLQLGPPPVVFREFVAREVEAVRNPHLRRWWKQQLTGVQATPLPRWRPQAGPPRVRVLSLPLPPPVHFGALVRRAQVSLKHALLAAHLAALQRLTGQRSVLTGLEANGRPALPRSEETLGMHMNILPLALTPSGSWLGLVRTAFEAERELLPSRHMPLVEIQRLLGETGLVETVFNFTHFHALDELSDLHFLRPLEAEGFDHTSFALRADFRRNPLADTLVLDLVADEARISGAQLRAIGEVYTLAVQSLLANPDADCTHSVLLSPAQSQLLLHEVQGTETAKHGPPDSSAPLLLQLIAAQATAHPEKPALDDGVEHFDYSRLWDESGRLAARLRTAGARPETLVGLCLERSARLVVATLAVLRAGAAYLPLDPQLPPRRLGALVADARPSLVLGEGPQLRRLRPELPAGGDAVPTLLDVDAPLSSAQPREPLLGPPSGDHLAYVLYTSGSTGRPKGVMVCHASVANLAASLLHQPGFDPADSVAAVTPLTFDISVVELLLPLAAGARVHVVDHETAGDGRLLSQRLRAISATVLQATPVTWRLLLDAGWTPPSRLERPGLKLLCGGEALTDDLAERLTRTTTSTTSHAAAKQRSNSASTSAPRLWNLYGPTETTVWSSLQRVRGGQLPVPLGQPLRGTRLYVLDTQRGPAAPLLPLAAEGELYIGGEGLARGYLGRPARTAGSFVPDPFSDHPGGRLYRTGDRVRRRPDSSLEFLGRIDYQLKLHGHRVEPGEIENALEAHAAVRQAVVIVPEGGAHRRLVAYLLTDPDRSLETSELRQFLSKRLPRYMVPSQLVWLDEFPLTSTGKVNRRQLQGRTPPKPGAPDPGRLQALLARLESMSDEEAEALLSGGDGLEMLLQD